MFSGTCRSWLLYIRTVTEDQAINEKGVKAYFLIVSIPKSQETTFETDFLEWHIFLYTLKLLIAFMAPEFFSITSNLL